jgi:hypothetical protein
MRIYDVLSDVNRELADVLDSLEAQWEKERRR